MKRLIVLALALAVSGCATFRNPLNITRLAQIESAYGIALSAAVAYRAVYKINPCTKAKPESATNICARRSVVVALQSADRKAQIALKAAQTFVHDNPTLDAASVITSAQVAIDAFRDIEKTNGVN